MRNNLETLKAKARVENLHFSDLEDFEKELREKLDEISEEQEKNNKLLKQDVPIAETTIFYNNGRWNTIKDILGDDNGL